MAKINRYGIFFILVIVAQLTGCGRTLVYQQTDFNPKDIDVITVFPLLDARQHVFAYDDFEEETEDIQLMILKRLKKKGYTFKVLNDTSTLGNIQPQMIPFLESERVRKIGPNDAHWILVPTVSALRTFGAVTPSYGEITCYIYNKYTGELVWEGSGNDVLLVRATRALMSDFPSNK